MMWSYPEHSLACGIGQLLSAAIRLLPQGEA